MSSDVLKFNDCKLLILSDFQCVSTTMYCPKCSLNFFSVVDGRLIQILIEFHKTSIDFRGFPWIFQDFHRVFAEAGCIERKGDSHRNAVTRECLHANGSTHMSHTMCSFP